MSQYARYFSLGSGSGSGVSSLNSLTGALSILAGSGITVTPSGSNITIAATGGGGGANTALSNLAATAVNSDINPGSDLAINLGSTSLRYLSVNTTEINSSASSLNIEGLSVQLFSNLITLLPSYTSDFWGAPSTFIGNVSDSDQTNQAVVIGSTDTSIVGNSTSATVLIAGDQLAIGSTGNTGGLGLSGGSISSGSGNSGGITLFAGNTDSGTCAGVGFFSGNSNTGVAGNILFSLGTGNAGSRGKFQIQDGSQGTAGQVWTSTDTVGSGNWQPATGGFTNPMTTAGDMIYESTTPAPVRLPIGTNGQVMTISGGLPTWSTLPVGTGANIAALLSMTSSPAISSGGTVIFDTVLFDTNSSYNISTGIYTAPTTGYYDIASTVTMTTNSELVLQKNGVSYLLFCTLFSGQASSGSATVFLNSGDTIQIISQQSGTIDGSSPEYQVYFSIIQIPSPSNPTADYAQAYFPQGDSWSVTSTTLADFSSTGTTPVLTNRTFNNLILTGAASDLPGVTFTPASSTAVYQITVSTTMALGAGGADGTLALTDSTITIVQRDSQILTSEWNPITMTGIYSPGTSSPVTVKLQGASTSLSAVIGSAGTIASAVEWTILRIM